MKTYPTKAEHVQETQSKLNVYKKTLSDVSGLPLGLLKPPELKLCLLGEGFLHAQYDWLLLVHNGESEVKTVLFHAVSELRCL